MFYRRHTSKGYILPRNTINVTNKVKKLDILFSLAHIVDISSFKWHVLLEWTNWKLTSKHKKTLARIIVCMHATICGFYYSFLRKGGGRNSLKVLKVEKSFLACFGHISIKIMLKINRERSERRNKWEKN